MTLALHTPQSLGLRTTRPQPAATGVGWLPWQVHTRTKGFHVSRESAGGTKVDKLLNDVGKTKIFRSRDQADTACAKANAAAGA